MGGGAGMMSMPGAGEVMLSRAETAALAALEGEDDEAHGMRRAQAESGLKPHQLAILKRRAATLSGKGYTLKGPNFVKKPLASSPDEPGLTRKAVKGDDSEDTAPAKPKKTKETALLVGRQGVATIERTVTGPELYTCEAVDGYRMPARSSDYDIDNPFDDNARETNTESALAAMLTRRSQKRRRAAMGSSY